MEISYRMAHAMRYAYTEFGIIFIANTDRQGFQN